jgi:putative ABC transport system ATP-binding protein
VTALLKHDPVSSSANGDALPVSNSLPLPVVESAAARVATQPIGTHSRTLNSASGGGGRDVHVSALTISYNRGQTSVTPVRDFTLYAPSGCITALVGRSGSGKTSILSCIAGMLRPESGVVWLGGIEVTQLKAKSLDDYRRNHVGVVHQAYNLIASLSARDNVAVPLTFAGIGRKRALEIATSQLQGLGLGEVLHNRPNQLSGGQQQRVAVARALSTGPSVVLADEPTAHLDGSSVNDVCSLLKMMAEQHRTVIVSTHDDRLLQVADQVVHLGGE